MVCDVIVNVLCLMEFCTMNFTKIRLLKKLMVSLDLPYSLVSEYFIEFFKKS